MVPHQLQIVARVTGRVAYTLRASEMSDNRIDAAVATDHKRSSELARQRILDSTGGARDGLGEGP